MEIIFKMFAWNVLLVSSPLIQPFLKYFSVSDDVCSEMFDHVCTIYKSWLIN